MYGDCDCNRGDGLVVVIPVDNSVCCVEILSVNCCRLIYSKSFRESQFVRHA